MSRIRNTLSVDIPLRQLFESPTIAGMAQTIEQIRQVGIVATKTVIDLNAEAVLDLTIQLPAVLKPKSIFLSGATGFLGAYLLYELLEQTTANIYCLVRAENADEGKKRLQSKLKSYFLWNETFRSRIIPIIGELSQPLLALSEQPFQDLANQIDVIYHNGALVNFVYPYHTLKATNVLGTQEILRLATHTKIKPVHYVSTLSVFDSYGYFDGRIIRETDALNDSEGLFFGYAQSKWVAEKLVMAARERGLPVCIYRPGTIVGHSQTNIWNPDDFIFRMIKGCIQLGKWPDINITLHLTPVDYVSQAIVHLSQQQESLGKAFHLLNSHHLQASQLFDWINSFGYPIQQTPYNKWQTELVNIVKYSQKNALSSLTSLFIEKVPCEEELTMPEMYVQGKVPHYDCQNTLNGLTNTSIICPPINEKLLGNYLSYFIQNNLLEKPSSSVQT
jgi:thioester reductase-like protein